MKLAALISVGIIGAMTTACGSNLGGAAPPQTPESTTMLTSAPAYPPSALRVDTQDPWAAPQAPLQSELKLDTADPWAVEAAPVAPATMAQPEPQPAPAAQP
ncbi:MAG TPA: hypothetical protein VIF62_16760 [Labilithrix sp.]|jgi:hypothetical protein